MTAFCVLSPFVMSLALADDTQRSLLEERSSDTITLICEADYFLNSGDLTYERCIEKANKHSETCLDLAKPFEPKAEAGLGDNQKKKRADLFRRISILYLRCLQSNILLSE